MKIKEDNKIFKYSDLSTKEQRNIVKKFDRQFNAKHVN
jgi:hypothetical protein